MRTIFADTHYWTALLSPKDGSHDAAINLSRELGSAAHIVTTEMILAEFLNTFAGLGATLKATAARFVRHLRRAHDVTIVAQTSVQFTDALEVYSRYGDKGWGLTDCASYVTMREHGIDEALTHDKHFEQMGFKALLRNPG